MQKYAKHFWYLASPYTLYETGLADANREACEASARLLRLGVPLFSPVAHAHAIAQTGLVNPVDHDFWMWLDGAFMEKAYGLIVMKLPGWTQSAGVQEEIRWFEDKNRPIIRWDVHKPDSARDVVWAIDFIEGRDARYIRDSSVPRG